MKKKRKKKITKKLLHKYRLILLNEETFEEKYTFKLSRLNIFVTLGISSIVLIGLTMVLIALTPLREYIPGYASSELRHQAMSLVYKTDSLEQVIEDNSQYFSSIQQILKGDTVHINAEDDIKESSSPTNIQSEDVDLSPSKEDSILRQEVEKKAKYNVLHPARDRANYKLFPPIKGQITENYNRRIRHFGIDISIAENQPVKAAADGKVVFAEWTVQTGYVIILQHNDGMISVYKHNSSLTKKQGEQVKAGEVIARTGDTGEYTTGPHLHFELWKSGYSIDPTEFLDFE